MLVVQLLKLDPSVEADVVKPATVFISHAWNYNFLDVVDSLYHHFQDKSLYSSTYIWLDIFSINQHDESVKGDFNWWNQTFKGAITQIAHTLLILSPWKDPLPLRRAWCLFEIFCTSSCSKCSFDSYERNRKPLFLEGYDGRKTRGFG